MRPWKLSLAWRLSRSQCGRNDFVAHTWLCQVAVMRNGVFKPDKSDAALLVPGDIV